MDSTYKQQLIRHIDGVSALERSGYGIPRSLAEKTINPFNVLAIVLVLTLVSLALHAV